MAPDLNHDWPSLTQSTQLGSLRISRLLVGGNPLSGFSHSSAARSQAMIDYFSVDNTKRLWSVCEQHGITACIARADNFVMRALHEHWRDGGRIRWIAQTAPEHSDPIKNITQAKRWGASAIFIHGGV